MMIDRNRIYLYLILGILMPVSIGCRQVHSSGKIVMKISHNGNEQHAFQKGYESIKEQLEKVSEGGVDFQIFPASQIASETEAVEMVKLGVIASTPVNIGALGSFVPEADLFNFPFLFRDLDHFYNVVDGPIGKQIAGKIEERLNCIVLGWWFAGIRNVWNSERPILKPQDLNGLKIRVIGSSIILDGFNSFGAQATNMSFGQLYSATQQKVIDGAECDYTDLHIEKFYEVTKYISNTEHLFSAVPLLYSKKQYDKLPPYLQDVIIEAGHNSVQVQREAMKQKTQEAFVALTQAGMIFNEVDKQPFQTLAKELYLKHAEKVGGMHLIEQIINQ